MICNHVGEGVWLYLSCFSDISDIAIAETQIYVYVWSLWHLYFVIRLNPALVTRLPLNILLHAQSNPPPVYYALWLRNIAVVVYTTSLTLRTSATLCTSGPPCQCNQVPASKHPADLQPCPYTQCAFCGAPPHVDKFLCRSTPWRGVCNTSDHWMSDGMLLTWNV